MGDPLFDDFYTLMLVTDRHRTRLPLPELVKIAVDSGVDIVQVREKDLPESELLALTEQIIIAADEKASVVVNGSLRVASALGIGVHLPENGTDIEEARFVLGDDVQVGRSVHSVEEAALSDLVDYLVAGPVFPTASKPDASPMSLKTFEDISNATSAPVYAIGGITPQRVPELTRASAFGVAVIGAICEADDPAAAAAEFRAVLDEMWQQDFGDIEEILGDIWD